MGLNTVSQSIPDEFGRSIIFDRTIRYFHLDGVLFSISRSTIREYLALLEQTFLIEQLHSPGFASKYGDCAIIDKLIKLVEQCAAKVRKMFAASNQ